jgi:hydroxymethylbilane synthase
MKRAVRIGTRGSRLALAQAREVRKRLSRRHRGTAFKLVIVKTTGDEFQSVELFKRNKTGVFTKAIEEKLLRGEIDLAVHSLKDLPTELSKGLCLAAIPKRLDPRDVIVSRGRYSLLSLPKGALVGTGSPRRKRQMLLARPDLRLVDIRGNLDTRVAKVLREKKLDAVVVARAGLMRLNKYLRYACPLSPRIVLPAVGQAALGIQARSGDRDILRLAAFLNHEATRREALAERGFLRAIEGGCRVPAGIYSKIRNGRLYLKAAVFSALGKGFAADALSGPAARSERLGERLAKRLLKKGAAGFVKEARGV